MGQGHRPILVERLGDIQIHESVRNAGEVSRVKSVVVGAPTLAYVEDGISSHVSLIEALSATGFALEAKLRAKAPVRGEVIGNLPIDSADSRLQIGIVERPVGHVNHRNDHRHSSSAQ
jgi:hypothetical protein